MTKLSKNQCNVWKVLKPSVVHQSSIPVGNQIIHSRKCVNKDVQLYTLDYNKYLELLGSNIILLIFNLFLGTFFCIYIYILTVLIYQCKLYFPMPFLNSTYFYITSEEYFGKILLHYYSGTWGPHFVYKLTSFCGSRPETWHSLKPFSEFIYFKWYS